MKKALIALAVVAFIVAGAAQPAFAQQQNDTNETQEPEQPENETETDDDEEETEDEDVNETEEEREEREEEREEMNETEESENESERAEGRSAQFDARLGVAIDTVSTLVEIAPNEEARTGLENALTSLREVQNNTDTASLGPEETPEAPEEAEEENETEDEETSEESESEEGQQGPPSDRGPSQNSNRPGFVNQMLGGLFG